MTAKKHVHQKASASQCSLIYLLFLRVVRCSTKLFKNRVDIVLIRHTRHALSYGYWNIIFLVKLNFEINVRVYQLGQL